MSDALARLRRLRPDYDQPSRYTSHRSKPRHDPEARAAVDLALRHIEIHADRFMRRDVIEAALRVAAPEVTTFRIAADLQRLLLCRVGVFPTSLQPNRAGPELTSSTAAGLKATIALEIDAALGERVLLRKPDEAMELLAQDTDSRLVVLAPHRCAGRALAVQCGGVEPIMASDWIAAMDRALSELGKPLPLRPSRGDRTLLLDEAWVLPNVDVLLILEISRRLGLNLILVEDPERFQVTRSPSHIIG